MKMKERESLATFLRKYVGLNIPIIIKTNVDVGGIKTTAMLSKETYITDNGDFNNHNFTEFCKKIGIDAYKVYIENWTIEEGLDENKKFVATLILFIKDIPNTKELEIDPLCKRDVKFKDFNS